MRRERKTCVCVCDDDTLLELCLTTAACQRVFLLFSSFFLKVNEWWRALDEQQDVSFSPRRRCVSLIWGGWWAEPLSPAPPPLRRYASFLSFFFFWSFKSSASALHIFIFLLYLLCAYVCVFFSTPTPFKPHEGRTNTGESRWKIKMKKQQRFLQIRSRRRRRRNRKPFGWLKDEE